LFCLWYFIKKPKDVIGWAMLMFLLGHMLVAHKEIRFLYPIACLLPVVLLDRINNIRRLPYQKTALWIFAIANVVLIVPGIFLPADQEISVLRFLEKDYAPSTYTLYYDGQNNPYNDGGLPNHFYGRKKPLGIAQEDLEKQPVKLPAVWISFNATLDGEKVGAYRLKRIYQTYPLFVTDYLNINNWVKRTSILTVYELEK
jgi:phosphatidylinositol glycan class B